MDYCLAPRLDGPDTPPFLCALERGHAGEHQAAEGLYRWPGTKPRPAPRADRKTTIVYRVKQHTNAPDHGIDTVIERFKRELYLQFNSTIEVEVLRYEDGE